MSRLAGRTIVNTRAPHQAAELDQRLAERGALTVPYPCIALATPDDTTELDAALRGLAIGAFDGLVLTSANTVQVLAERVRALGLHLEPGKVRVAAVGPATAQAAGELLGLGAQTVPEEYVAEALADALHPSAGLKLLLPQSALAADTLLHALAAHGAQVTGLDAYTMRLGSGGVNLLPLLRDGKIDAVTLTSGSTAQNLLERLALEGGDLSALEGVVIACIGPKTADSARSLGLAVTVTPDDYTLDGLVQALDAYFAAENG
jgi:uroporphyrinogen-III synthase